MDPAVRVLLGQHWDYVVLQEQSAFGTPEATDWVVWEIDSMVRAHCGKTLLYTTNGFPADFYNSIRYIINGYTAVMESNRVSVVPCGNAWRKLMVSGSTINPFNGGDYHPSIYGQYLNACVFFSALYRRSSSGLPTLGGISATSAATLQGIASSMVLDSLDQWRLVGLTQAMSSFRVSQNGLQVNLRDSSSSHAVSYKIAFGDGHVQYTDRYPPTGISHTYSASGSYSIRQTIYTSCDSAVHTQQVIVQLPVSIEPDRNKSLKLYPNPAIDKVAIAVEGSLIEEIQLLDVHGRILQFERFAVPVEGVTTRLEWVAPGSYFINCSTTEGRFYKQLFIK
jgi:hypothetical protein